MASATSAKVDLRPRLYDHISGQYLLLDTGACCSIYPRKWFKFLNKDPSKNLRAVNGTQINTYGTQKVQIQPQKSNPPPPYTHDVIVGEIDQAILGWDWILAYKLDLQWKKGKCRLLDNNRGMSYPLSLDTVNANQLGLSVVNQSFKQYAQERSEINSKKEKPVEIPSQYMAIVEKYPTLQKVNFIDKPLHGVTHTINTGNHKPCKATVRPLMPNTPKARAAEKAWKQLEDIGVIEKVKAGDPTLWSSPLHLAVKSDGTLRPCGDYRGLNAKTEQDCFPLPNIRNFGSKLRGSTIFSSVDIYKAYYNIELDPESAKKATVVTEWGTYIFKRLAMGLKNSAASFQRFMSTILDGLPGVFCYLDDILLFDTDEEQHKKSLNTVFQILQQNGLTINLKKCQFARKEINFLGFKVSGSGITPLPRKLEAIADYPPLKNQNSCLFF